MIRIPPPDARELLLPILACLPTAFLSPRPPPALLPLLTPILRQRVHVHTSSASSQNRRPDPSDPRSSWLHLLTWSPERAKRLAEIVSNLQLEPHPVSGEIELFLDDDEGGKIRYRRLDSETLQAKCNIDEHGLSVVWMWCTNDDSSVGLGQGEDAAETGTAQPADGWKVAEVRPLEVVDGEEKHEKWYESMTEANDAEIESNGIVGTVPLNGGGQDDKHPRVQINEDDDDDSDYWAAYDRTPGRTPRRTPATTPGINGKMSDQLKALTAMRRPSENSNAAEQAYYERYGAEVQPSMDAHDPDEEASSRNVPSTLHPTSSSKLRSSISAHDQAVDESEPKRTSYSSVPASEYAAWLEQQTGAAGPLPVTEPPSHHSSVDSSYILSPQSQASSKSSSSNSVSGPSRGFGSISQTSPPRASLDPKTAAAAAALAGIDPGPVLAAQEELERQRMADAGEAIPPANPEDARAIDAIRETQVERVGTNDTMLQIPSPTRPDSAGSDGSRKSNKSQVTAQLEMAAASGAAAEVGVKQHISMEIKSLYRLAKGVGIERSEFERVIRTELDVLGMLEF